MQDTQGDRHEVGVVFWVSAQALESGEIDLYWEYTATGWLIHLSQTDSISDPREHYKAVARQDLEENGIKWLHPAPGNDTYAIAASENTAETSGLRPSRI